MKLDEIVDAWEIDAKINSMNIDISSEEIPCLHAKYLKLYTQISSKLKESNNILAKVRHKKTLYYSGRLSQDEMDSHNWPYDPFNGGSKPLKAEVSKWVDVDDDVVKLESIIENDKLIKEALSLILEQIKWRNQTIKNIIDFRKFQSGLM